MGWMPPGYLILPPTNSTVKEQVRVGERGMEEDYVQGRVQALVFTLFHIFTDTQGARRKEWAPALFSCIKKHQCPGLDAHCRRTCRGAQGLIVTD